MNQSISTIKLSLLQVILTIGVSLITFFLLLLFPLSDIGDLLHLDKFDYWYYNGLVPCIQAFICTLTGSLVTRRHYLGGWIAGGAVLAVFGGLDIYLRDADQTDRPIQSLEFMIVGVALGIIVLHVWQLFKKRKTL